MKWRRRWGGVGGRGGAQRVGHTFSQIGCDKTTLPCPLHIATRTGQMVVSAILPEPPTHTHAHGEHSQQQTVVGGFFSNNFYICQQDREIVKFILYLTKEVFPKKFHTHGLLF